MSITNELKTELVKFVTVFYQAQASLKELQNLSAVYVSMPTMWVGNNLNALIQARIRQYCKQYESGFEDCGASIDYQTVKEALMQNIGFFDEYDRDADTA